MGVTPLYHLDWVNPLVVTVPTYPLIISTATPLPLLTLHEQAMQFSSDIHITPLKQVVFFYFRKCVISLGHKILVMLKFKIVKKSVLTAC